LRKVLIVLLALVAGQAEACSAPRGGPEYDQLIEIIKLKAPNTYQVAVPARLEDLQKAEIILAYSDTYAGGIPIYDAFETLNAKQSKGKLTATFTVEYRDNSKPYIVVMWWPNVCCPCGIQANTEFLDVS
jgi:hypothetical protein